MEWKKKALSLVFCLLLAVQVAAPVIAGVFVAWWVIATVTGSVAALTTGAIYYDSGSRDPDGSATLVIDSTDLTQAAFYWHKGSKLATTKLVESGKLHPDPRGVADYYSWRLEPVSFEFTAPHDPVESVTIAFKRGDEVIKIYTYDAIDWDERGASEGDSTWRLVNWTKVPQNAPDLKMAVNQATEATNMKASGPAQYLKVRGIGGLGFDQVDIAAWLSLETGDDFEIGNLRIDLEKNMVVDIVTALNDNDPSVHMAKAAGEPEPVQIHFVDASGKSIKEPADGKSPVTLKRGEPFTVVVEGLPKNKDKANPNYVGYFGAEPILDAYQMNAGRAVGATLQNNPPTSSSFVSLFTPGTQDFGLNPEYPLTALDDSLCTPTPGRTEQVDCKFTVSNWAGDNAFETAPADPQTLVLFSDYGGRPGIIENKEMYRKQIQFEAYPKTPLDFTLSQVDVYGKPPQTDSCTSRTPSTPEKPTCVLASNRAFSLRFEQVVENNNPVYFNAEKDKEGRPFINGKDTFDILVKEKAATSTVLQNVFQVRAAANLTVKNKKAGSNVYDVVAPVSLNSKMDETVVPGATGYYAVDTKCPGRQKVADNVFACAVDVDRVNGEKTWEDVLGVELVVFSDSKGDGEGTLSADEIVRYYIQFKPDTSSPCLSVMECLAEIDKKLATEGKDNGPLFEWGKVSKGVKEDK